MFRKSAVCFSVSGHVFRSAIILRLDCSAGFVRVLCGLAKCARPDEPLIQSGMRLRILQPDCDQSVSTTSCTNRQFFRQFVSQIQYKTSGL